MRHPWLAQIPGAASLDDQTRILTFIAGNTASGNSNINTVAVLYSYVLQIHHYFVQAISRHWRATGATSMRPITQMEWK